VRHAVARRLPNPRPIAGANCVPPTRLVWTPRQVRGQAEESDRRSNTPSLICGGVGDAFSSDDGKDFPPSTLPRVLSASCRSCASGACVEWGRRRTDQIAAPRAVLALGYSAPANSLLRWRSSLTGKRTARWIAEVPSLSGVLTYDEGPERAAEAASAGPASDD